MVKINVTGVQSAVDSVIRVSDRLVTEFRARGEARAEHWKQVVKAAIEHFVYDAYSPTVYDRKGYLSQFLGTSVRGGTASEPGGGVVIVEVFDQPDQVPLNKGDVSAGGSRRGETPFEIEEGDYPAGWWPPASNARRAWETAADIVGQEAQADADEIVSRALSTP